MTYSTKGTEFEASAQTTWTRTSVVDGVDMHNHDLDAQQYKETAKEQPGHADNDELHLENEQVTTDIVCGGLEISQPQKRKRSLQRISSSRAFVMPESPPPEVKELTRASRNILHISKASQDTCNVLTDKGPVAEEPTRLAQVSTPPQGNDQNYVASATFVHGMSESQPLLGYDHPLEEPSSCTELQVSKGAPPSSTNIYASNVTIEGLCKLQFFVRFFA